MEDPELILYTKQAKKFNMDPKKTKNNSDVNRIDSENNSEYLPTGENSENEKNDPEKRETEEKSKKKWDDREIDFDQLIF